MAKNERIIAQDLTEIKGAIQSNDFEKLSELCKVLRKEIKKYPVKPDIFDRLEKITGYDISPSNLSIHEKILEIDNLVDLLISS